MERFRILKVNQEEILYYFDILLWKESTSLSYDIIEKILREIEFGEDNG